MVTIPLPSPFGQHLFLLYCAATFPPHNGTSATTTSPSTPVPREQMVFRLAHPRPALRRGSSGLLSNSGEPRRTYMQTIGGTPAMVNAWRLSLVGLEGTTFGFGAGQ